MHFFIDTKRLLCPSRDVFFKSFSKTCWFKPNNRTLWSIACPLSKGVYVTVERNPQIVLWMHQLLWWCPVSNKKSVQMLSVWLSSCLGPYLGVMVRESPPDNAVASSLPNNSETALLDRWNVCLFFLNISNYIYTSGKYAYMNWWILTFLFSHSTSSNNSRHLCASKFHLPFKGSNFRCKLNQRKSLSGLRNPITCIFAHSAPWILRT